MEDTRKRSSDECSPVSDVAKNQKLAPLEFGNLPNEIILQILKKLDIKDLLHCGMVSKRIRIITRNESLWEKINLYGNNVPLEFLQLVLDLGCKYLSLHDVGLKGDISEFQLRKPSKLRCLDLHYCLNNTTIIENILASCLSLEKLDLNYVPLTPNMIKSICSQNSQTLEVLILSARDKMSMSGVYKILGSCAKLRELSLLCHVPSRDTAIFLENNLHLNIEKLDLYINDRDEPCVKLITNLVSKCQNLKSLRLNECTVRDETITAIIRHLNQTLEELELNSRARFEKLLELRSMPNLKVFNCYQCYLCYSEFKKEEVKTLTNNLPHLIRPINKKKIEIAETFFSQNQGQVWF